MSLSASSFDEFGHHERREKQNGDECAGECSLRVDVLGALGAIRDPLASAHLGPLLVAGNGSALKKTGSADSTTTGR